MTFFSSKALGSEEEEEEGREGVGAEELDVMVEVGTEAGPPLPEGRREEGAEGSILILGSLEEEEEGGREEEGRGLWAGPCSGGDEEMG